MNTTHAEAVKQTSQVINEELLRQMRESSNSTPVFTAPVQQVHKKDRFDWAGLVFMASILALGAVMVYMWVERLSFIPKLDQYIY